MAKKLLALLVAAMMVLALVPAAALAKTNPKTDTVENADPAPKPAPGRTVIDSWDFEEDPLENGWQFLDNDEDGNNWSWQSSSYVHSGSYSIMSASYSGTALTPDNWAMSPWFSVPEGGANLTFWVQNFSGSYPETYSVYFIVYGDEGWNEIALDESVSGSAMVEMSYFIPDTAGLQARIAIRHHDCTDQWRFYIDDVEISTPTFPESINVNDVTVPVGRHTNVVYELLPEDTTATDVTFEIDDTSIATVDANGVVTGVAEGTATITVTSVAVPTVSGTATVTVTEAPPTAHLEGFATYDLGGTYTNHFVAFTDADPGTVTDLVNFNTTTYAAAYYDGTVYGYNYNSSSNPAETNYYTMNAETYEVVYPGGDASAVDGVFAMAYNYANDTMYGIVGTDTRSIATIDLETGEATIVAAITGIDTPMTLAIDGEGNAYVLGYGDNAILYSLDLETGEATEIGETGVGLNYVQSMTWDHATNQLFWAQIYTASNHGLYVIDPETGAASALGTIGDSGMEITCLYSKSAPGEEPPTELLPITEVYVNGYESPVAGEDSQNHLNFTVPADAHYTIETESYSAPCWWDNDTDLPFYDIFVEGTNYSAGMTLIAEEGYYFADDCVFYVNGSEDLVDYTYTGIDEDDATFCYLWTVPEEAAPAEVPPTEEPPTNPPTDEPVEGLIVGYYFETQEEVDEWTFVGGDTNWVWSFDNPGGYDYTELAHEGEGFIMSYSFVDYVGSYQANNWAISPAVTLPSGTASVSFYASNANSSYPETFSVYVGTTPNTADMTLLQTITPSTGYEDEWSYYEIDLSDYAGQTIYLAFYDQCYDMYEIWIDQVEFWGEGGEQPPVPTMLGDVELDGDVDAADAILALRYCMGLVDLNDLQLEQADVNLNGSINIDDAIMILRAAMGLITLG